MKKLLILCALLLAALLSGCAAEPSQGQTAGNTSKAPTPQEETPASFEPVSTDSSAHTKAPTEAADPAACIPNEDKHDTCEPVRDNLPERCYSVLSGSDEIIIIKRGEKGYFKTDIPVTDKDEARSIANEYNAKLGVSRAQEEAMKAGSMFGFQVPAADPRNYDADGKPVMPKDRGDAR